MNKTIKLVLLTVSIGLIAQPQVKAIEIPNKLVAMLGIGFLSTIALKGLFNYLTKQESCKYGIINKDNQYYIDKTTDVYYGINPYYPTNTYWTYFGKQNNFILPTKQNRNSLRYFSSEEECKTSFKALIIKNELNNAIEKFNRDNENEESYPIYKKVNNNQLNEYISTEENIENTLKIYAPCFSQNFLKNTVSNQYKSTIQRGYLETGRVNNKHQAIKNNGYYQVQLDNENKEEANLIDIPNEILELP